MRRPKAGSQSLLSSGMRICCWPVRFVLRPRPIRQQILLWAFIALKIYVLTYVIWHTVHEFLFPLYWVNQLKGMLKETTMNPRHNCVVQAKRVVGLYREDVLTPRLKSSLKPEWGTENTVVVTAANFGYRMMLDNLMCNFDDIGWKYLVISVDPDINQYMQEHHPSTPNCLVPENFDQTFVNKTTRGETQFRQKSFNIVSYLKIATVRLLLENGFNVLFVDSDIRFRKDVWPAIASLQCDYTFQQNRGDPIYPWDSQEGNPEHEGNTGFYLIRNNAYSRALFNKAVNATVGHVERYRQNFHLDDQTIFWDMMKEEYHQKRVFWKTEGLSSPQPQGLTYCALNGMRFASGWVFKDAPCLLREIGVKIDVVHSNFMLGLKEKINALKRHGWWQCHGKNESVKYHGWDNSQRRWSENNEDKELVWDDMKPWMKKTET